MGVRKIRNQEWILVSWLEKLDDVNAFTEMWNPSTHKKKNWNGNHIWVEIHRNYYSNFGYLHVEMPSSYPSEYVCRYELGDQRWLAGNHLCNVVFNGMKCMKSSRKRRKKISIQVLPSIRNAWPPLQCFDFAPGIASLAISTSISTTWSSMIFTGSSSRTRDSF